MDEKKRREFYDKLMARYGEIAQITVCIEEMSELTKELCKYLRLVEGVAPNYDEEKIRQNIIEEVGDVILCAEQMKHHFGWEDVDKSMDYKIARTNNRILEDKN